VVRDLTHVGVYLAIMLNASKMCWGRAEIIYFFSLSLSNYMGLTSFQEKIRILLFTQTVLLVPKVNVHIAPA